MWLLCSLLLLTPAHAETVEGGFVQPPSPYQANAPRTAGRLEGFREVRVGEDFADELGAPRGITIPTLSAFDEDPAAMLLGFMPVVHLGVDGEQLQELGLSLDDLAAVLPEARRHERSGDGSDLLVLLEGAAEAGDPQPLLLQISQLTLSTSDGRTVPLSQLTSPWVGERSETRGAEGVNPSATAGVVATTSSPPPPSEEPPHPARGDLPIHNPGSAWARVSVDGHQVGVIGPRDTAWIRDVRWGAYPVELRYPSGYTRHSEVGTE